MGGMVLETNANEILLRIEEQNKLEKQEVSYHLLNTFSIYAYLLNNSFPFQAGLSTAPARAVSAVKNMNIPQQIKDMKLPDLPNIGGLKF